MRSLSLPQLEDGHSLFEYDVGLNPAADPKSCSGRSRNWEGEEAPVRVWQGVW